jgi:hypothetical protein
VALITDPATGQQRPYDPDLDYDTPLHLFGALLPDPNGATAAPLNPLRDLTKGTKR